VNTLFLCSVEGTLEESERLCQQEELKPPFMRLPGIGFLALWSPLMETLQPVIFLLVCTMQEKIKEDCMTPEDREALFHVARWVVGRKRLVVKKVRQLAGTEENYLFIIREIDRVKSQVERAKMLQVEATLTLVDWLTILELFDWRCAYCLEKPFQVMSHVIPLPAGGTTPENCVPACYSCSSGRREFKQHERGRLQASLTEAKRRREHEESVSALLK